jgi:solute carrier family 10 (sodium/bile acid cotransporter), member 7
LALQTSEVAAAFARWKFDVFVQMFTFFVTSAMAYGISHFLVDAGVLLPALGNGLVVVSCLPMAIHSVVLLTQQAGGETAAAGFHATFSNFLGIVVSPVLVLGYVGTQSDVPLPSVIYKLTLRVIAPFIVGQGLHESRWVVNLAKKYKRGIKNFNFYGLIWIVYTMFCRTFLAEQQPLLVDIFVMVCVEFVFYTGMIAVAWYSLQCIVPHDQPQLRVVGMLACSSKAVSSKIGGDAKEEGIGHVVFSARVSFAFPDRDWHCLSPHSF